MADAPDREDVGVFIDEVEALTSRPSSSCLVVFTGANPVPVAGGSSPPTSIHECNIAEDCS